MKRILSVMLVLAMLFSLGCVSFADGFDASKLQSSDLYTFEASKSSWKIVGGYNKEYKDVGVDIYLFLSSGYVKEKWGPDLRVYFYDKDNDYYDTVDTVRFIVDDKVYSFESLEKSDSNDCYLIFGGNIMREFLNSLSSAIRISFEIVHTTKEGKTYTATIDPVYASELKDFTEMAKLFEKANLWDPKVTEMDDNDALYKASIADNPSFDKSMYTEGNIYLAMKDAYAKGDYTGCLDFCNRLGDYKDTQKYTVLAMSHKWYDYCETLEDINTLTKALVQIIDFEDAKDLLVCNDYFAECYLKGYWVGPGGGITFEMRDNGYTTTAPVVPQSGNTYEIVDGILYKWFTDNPSRRTPNYQFIPISDKEFYIYSFQTDLYYPLNKIR